MIEENESKKLVIIGAGGFGREVCWLVKRINQTKQFWQVEGFIDDTIERGELINRVPVLGNLEDLQQCSEKMGVVCAVGSAAIRKKIIVNLKKNQTLYFPNLIDPSVCFSEDIKMGEGNIICAGTILTTNITLGNFNILNLNCTIGHDVIIEDFVTVYPGVNISGKVVIGNESELGTGAKIIQGKKIINKVVVGAGAVITKDITEQGTYVGVPAKKREIYNGLFS